MAQTDRAEALRRLAELGAGGAIATTEAPTVERTGTEVYAGGDVARLLVGRAHLSYMDGGVRHYPAAEPGDTVLLTEAVAKRLDALGVTVDPDASDEEVEAATADDGIATDEQLEAMKAEELVAYVGQHPDERDRVRTLEESRDTPRKTVLAATDPDAGTE